MGPVLQEMCLLGSAPRKTSETAAHQAVRGKPCFRRQGRFRDVYFFYACKEFFPVPHGKRLTELVRFCLHGSIRHASAVKSVPKVRGPLSIFTPVKCL